MVCESFGLSLHDFREPLLEGVRDRGMQRCASALQESRVGSVPHKRVLKGIDRLGYLAPAEYQFRLNQLGERLLKSLFLQPSYGAQQFVRELATHHSADRATSLTGANRSSLAISDACNVVGIAIEGRGRLRT